MKSLVYRLKLFLIIKIHFIVLIIQLKFVSKNDFYNRIRNINFFFIKEEAKMEKNDIKFYKIEILLKKAAF